MARWRPTPVVEPPAWVRVYDPADWPDVYTWTEAADNWLTAHHVDAATHWAWVLAIPDEPFDPYGDAA
jgi:hypothetical protein